MSGERFLVLFNSQGSNVVSSTNLNNVLYNVNWGSFLPKDYKRFRCQFVFKSNNTTTGLTLNGLVSMNMGKVNVYDGNSMTTNLGFIYPVSVSGGTTTYFYNSTNNDNNDFYIDYPANNQITVSLKQFDNTSNLLAGGLNSSLHYVIYLSLEGIIE